ncbi:hypothetical protein AJ88_19035 [Mesorhizobium amorphae CCBAU 01583]|nr:hypothetical protein AJ88_19035 [Mesorhizobium amorphae CCBAU 01583]
MVDVADPFERKLAAILAADVSGYSRMMEVDEAGTLARMRAHIGEVVRPRIAAHRGNIVKTTGDGLLVEFASVVEAVESAVEIQRSMAERNSGEPENTQILYRVGINLGDVMFEDGDVFGDGVNVASRLEGLAKPGGVCVSDIVHQAVEDRIQVPFRDMGNQRVKNISRPIRAGSGRPTRRCRRLDLSRWRCTRGCSSRRRRTACNWLGPALARERRC